MDLKGIIKYIIGKTTGFSSVINYGNGVIYFDFGNRDIRFTFSPINDFIEESDRIISLEELDIDHFCENYVIQSFHIANTTTFSEEDEDEKEIYNKPYYIEMLYDVKQINKYFPDAITNYLVNTYIYDDCGWEMGCPIIGEYGYKIEIAPKYWFNIEFISHIINDLFTHHISSTIWDKYKLSLQDSITIENVNIISSNTKSRRLGYLKYIISLFEGKRFLSEQIMLNLVEKDIDKLQLELMTYKNSKGLVQRKNLKTSLFPYIEIALSMQLIQIVNNGYELTKLGVVYERLLRWPEIKNNYATENSFDLNLIDKSLFLETILNNDYIYIYTILEYAYTINHPSYVHLKQIFQTRIINNIDKIIETNDLIRDKSLRKLKEIKKRVQAWTKADVYMEHVLMPRLNWLYDLDILVLKNDLSFEITPHGEILMRILASFNDYTHSFNIAPQKFFEYKFMQLIDDVFISGSTIDKQQTRIFMPQYIELCFSMFKTLAPNRVTYSIMVAFVKRLFLVTKHLIVEEITIKEFLLENPDKYIFKYQKYYQDGYVQLKK